MSVEYKARIISAQEAERQGIKKEEAREANSYIDPFEKEYGEEIIEPPYPYRGLLELVRTSSSLPPCIDAMKQNCEGFGYNIVPCVKENENEKYKKEITSEKEKLKNFLEYAGIDSSFTQLRKMLREDLETFGNAFAEIIRTVSGEIAGFQYIPAISMRLTKQSDKIETSVLKRKEGSYEYEDLKYKRRFRRYVQIVGSERVYFKEFGDPREIDAKTGEYFENIKKEDLKEIVLGSEVKHFKINDPESPYGTTRWLGAIRAISGSAAVEDVNFRYFNEKAIPPLIISVAGGKLAPGSDEVIKEFLAHNMKGRENFHKILVLEAVGTPSPNSLEKENVKIEYKELKQLSDAVFLQYDKENREKIRSAFRLPPIYIGLSEDYTRATARESKEIAEEQIFVPERADFDFFINYKILPMMGIKYIKFETKSPRIENNKDVAETIKTMAETSLTFRQSNKLLEKIIGFELEFPEEWQDIPVRIAPYIINKMVKDADRDASKSKEKQDQEKSTEKLIKTLWEIRGKLKEELRLSA